MSFIDKFLDIMRLNDDEYEYDNEEYDLDEEEEEAPKKSFRKEKNVEKEPARENLYETREKVSKPTPKITPIAKSSTRKQAFGMEVCVIKPTTIEDEIELTDTLLNGRTVVINMEGLNVEIAQRIIDFTSGSTYAMRGNLQKISNYIFLATPNGVDISVDISNIMDSFDSSGFSF